jgi:hypothetical protein
MSINFAALLDKKVSDVKKPEPLPTGAYDMCITGYSTGTSSKNETPYVEISLKPISAREDVDQEALANIDNLNDITLKTQFYLTEKSMWRLQDFLGKAGFDVEGDQTFSEMLAECAGHNVVAVIGHRASKDGTAVFAEINSFLSAE